MTVDEPVIAKLVVVALVRNVLPVSVDEAAKSPPKALSSEEIVVEPVTASEVEVAPLSEVPPSTVSAAFRLVAPATLNTEPMVEEPKRAKLVPVALVKSDVPRVEDAE